MNETDKNLEEFLAHIRKQILDYIRRKKANVENRLLRNQLAFEWIEKYYSNEFENFLKKSN